MRIWLSFAAGLMIVSGLQVTGASAQSLEDALASAYSNNPSLAAQRASLRATDEQVPQAISGWRPTVSMSTSYGSQAVHNNTSSGTARGQHRDPASVSLKVTQPLYSGGSTVAATKKAVNNVRAARERLLSTEQTVLLDAVTAYMNVVRDQAVLELNVNNEQVLRRQLEATQDRFNVGEVTRTDVYQAEARLSGATSNRIQAEGSLEVSRAAYRKVIGESPEKLVQPAVPADIPKNSGEAIDAALANNPDVLATQYDERASNDNVTEIRGELLPEVSLVGSASRNYDSAGESTRISDFKAQLSVSVPLYQSGSVYSRLRSARQSAAKSRQDIEAARRGAIQSATQAWETLSSARASIEAIKSQVNANEVALDGVRREADVGSRTILDVLNAEQELLDSRVSLVRAQRDLIVAVYDLKSAIGALTAGNLKLPVHVYDPEQHYLEVRGKWFGGTSSGDSKSGE